MACDYWLKSLGGADYREEHKALTKRFKLSSTDVILAKPQTYMNLSGESVVAIMNFYKIPKENLIVAHDDIDLPFGTMKIQHNRGAGGQNGVKSISQLLGHNEYARLKIGVGRPSHPTPHSPEGGVGSERPCSNREVVFSDFLTGGRCRCRPRRCTGRCRRRRRGSRRRLRRRACRVRRRRRGGRCRCLP